MSDEETRAISACAAAWWGAKRAGLPGAPKWNEVCGPLGLAAREEARTRMRALVAGRAVPTPTIADDVALAVARELGLCE